MRGVIQRALNGNVKVSDEIIGEIDKGLVVFVGFSNTDIEEDLKYLAEKVLNLRIFEDENEKMNLSLKDINGDILIIPNFTLYGDVRKGKRPSFIKSGKVDESKKFFDDFVKMIKAEYSGKVSTGQFQSDMKVNVLNDGPVTILIDSDKKF